MKELKQFFTLTLLALIGSAFTSLQVVASEAPSIAINKIGYEKKISVTMKNLSGSTTLTLSVEGGNTLIEEAIKDSEYSKVFNLGELEPGTYVLSISNGLREIEQPLVINERTLVLDQRQRREFFAPLFRNNGESIDLQLMAGKMTTVSLSIRNLNGEVVFEDQLKNVIKVERRYSLRQLPAGQYTVMVTTPEKEYFFEVRK